LLAKPSEDMADQLQRMHELVRASHGRHRLLHRCPTLTAIMDIPSKLMGMTPWLGSHAYAWHADALRLPRKEKGSFLEICR
jgi:hypothetical protein